jgi:teichuronic acid biosynthesis glycosyltransferase TuaC
LGYRRRWLIYRLMMLRVLVLSTLFPNTARPVFGTFVERQTLGLAGHPDVELQIVVPRGLPPAPFDRARQYETQIDLPATEMWHGVKLYRPRFLHLPIVGARFDAQMIVAALTPLLHDIRETFPFDVIAAEYFFPDGVAAVALGQRFNVPMSIKARGSDIHLWGNRKDTRGQVVKAGQKADAMLAVSASMKRDMEAMGMPGDRIRVHYTGADRALFHVRDRAAAKAQLGITGPLIVSIAPLIPRKALDLVVAAMADVPTATYVIAGAGPEADRLTAQAAALGIGERVRLIGSQPRDQVALWLAAADVMALPSRSEGLANAWVEALASGTPIVIADVDGATELVDRAEAGRFVPHDPRAIAAAINDLIAHPPDRQAVAAAANKFSWEANRDILFDHLTRLVDARNHAQI